MAIIKCPECFKEVSDSAVSCPDCGFGVAQHLEEKKKREEKEEQSKKEWKGCCGCFFIMPFIIYFGFTIIGGAIENIGERALEIESEKEPSVEEAPPIIPVTSSAPLADFDPPTEVVTLNPLIGQYHKEILELEKGLREVRQKDWVKKSHSSDPETEMEHLKKWGEYARGFEDDRKSLMGKIDKLGTERGRVELGIALGDLQNMFNDTTFQKKSDFKLSESFYKDSMKQVEDMVNTN